MYALCHRDCLAHQDYKVSRENLDHQGGGGHKVYPVLMAAVDRKDQEDKMVLKENRERKVQREDPAWLVTQELMEDLVTMDEQEEME